MTEKMSKASGGDLKCYRCSICDGYGCPNMLPGLGGVLDGKNFQLNYEGWRILFGKAAAEGKAEDIRKIKVTPGLLRCGPVTGAVENVGYNDEADFYLPYLKNAVEAGLGLCVGDGCPDEKLKLGVEAVKTIQSVKAAFFLKPYPQEKLFERIEWVRPYASHIGIDIDSYNILTMRNRVNLERKSAAQLEEFRNRSKLPFVIKGVFTEEDISLVRAVKPDVVYISDHGGRVETRIGSTAQFLADYATELKKFCKEIWVDGGIRTQENIQTAVYYGADQVIIARPLIRATFDNHYTETVKELTLC